MSYTDLSKTEIANMLKQALNTDHVYEVYQPKFAAITNELVGVETLVRWKDPHFGFIPPSVFVPIAEQSGLVYQLTRKVMKDAITQCAAWNALGHYLNVAINVSTLDLEDPDIVLYYCDLLQTNNVDPSHITLEITETAIVEDRERCASILATMRAMGTKLSVDDFGTGHASFVYLKHFPITEIKLDQMFIKDMTSNAFDKKLIRSMIHLAQEIGCKVVAEGVENGMTAHELRLMGVNSLQGYYFSKPVTPNDIVEMFLSNQLVHAHA